jgi:hypothetical protein
MNITATLHGKGEVKIKNGLTDAPPLFVRADSILFINEPSTRTYLLGQALTMVVFVGKGDKVRGRVMAIPDYENIKDLRLCQEHRCHYVFEGTLKEDVIQLSYHFEGSQDMEPMLEVSQVRVFFEDDCYVGEGFNLTAREGRLLL